MNQQEKQVPWQPAKQLSVVDCIVNIYKVFKTMFSLQVVSYCPVHMAFFFLCQPSALEANDVPWHCFALGSQRFELIESLALIK